MRKDNSSKLGWILVGICVLGGLAVPVTRAVLPKYKPPSGPLTLARESKSGLSLTQANFEGEGASRFISGDVRNHSAARATNVVVTINLHIDSDSVSGTAVGRISSVEPNGVSHFQTGPIPEDVHAFMIRDIVSDQE